MNYRSKSKKKFRYVSRYTTGYNRYNSRSGAPISYARPLAVPRQYMNNGSRSFKLRTTQTALPVGIQNITNSPDGYPDWSNIAALFEYYRATGLSIKWIPHSTEAIGNAAPTQRPIYIIHDWNNLNEVFTQAYMLAHEAMTIKHTTSSWTYYRKTKETAPPYLQIEGSFAGFMRTTDPVPTNVIRLWNTDAATTNGTLIVTLYIIAQYRK